MRFIRVPFSMVITIIFFLQATAQPGYWQQELKYKITVELNDNDHELDGFLELHYRNNSPDTLGFIWFHLWPNAFKNDKTAFTHEQLKNGNTSFYFADRNQRGYINQLDFKAGAISLEVEDHPTHIDIVKVLLDRPLLPGSAIVLTTPFHVKLPVNFAGLGHNGIGGQSYQLTNWYPRPAVYDRFGWHPMPFLAGAPGYGDFGSFEVSLKLPRNYVVVASGDLMNREEIDWLKSRKVAPVRKKIPAPKNKNSFKKLPSKLAEIPSDPAKKTLDFNAGNINDFAIFADKYFVVRGTEISLASGKKISANVYYHSEEENLWTTGLNSLNQVLTYYSEVLADYPYNSINLVQAEMGSKNEASFPMIAAMGGAKFKSTFTDAIQHEAGGQWFGGILGSDHSREPWMSKGLIAFYNDKRRSENSGKAGVIDSPSFKYGLEAHDLRRIEIQKTDQPIQTSAPDMSEERSRLIAGYKASVWLSVAERELGPGTFREAMKDFVASWKFRHPAREDLKRTFEKYAGRDLGGLFGKLDSTGPLLPSNSSTKLVTIFSRLRTDSINKEHTNPVGINGETRVNYIEVLPIPGFNTSDGFMIGAAVHNYRLPYNRFHFFVAPLYATRSQQANLFSHMDYALYPGKWFRRVSFGAGAERFSTLSGIDSNGKRLSSGFVKFTPSVKAFFKNRLLSDSREHALEWKTFVIGENGFSYSEKISDGVYYPAKSKTVIRYLNQLTYSISDTRVLYPYSLNLQAQQAKDFYRINLDAGYLFNYAKGGGMNVRFFAAKFGYIGEASPASRFATFRYQPKLTAVRGDEDYTYSNYFVGRNESEGITSQQIMMRDGGLKIRTDMFQGLQGRSDDWVAAMNFNTTIPAGIMPRVIPLRIFFDIGTYSGAWEKDADATRFLYVGGLQLSLFRNLLNVYAPLIYSKTFSDNLKTVPDENKFFRKISFSIDIHRFNHSKLPGARLNY